VGQLHKRLAELDRIVDFKEEVELFRSYIEKIDHEYVTGITSSYNDAIIMFLDDSSSLTRLNR
jgi:hypothetical protein